MTGPTQIELLERPLACNHGAIFLSLFLLSDLEVDERATIRWPSKLQVLPVAVALIDAINKDVHCDTWCDEFSG